MGLLGALTTIIPPPPDTPWRGGARRRVWRWRGDALWAVHHPPVTVCRRLHFEGWEHLHQAIAQGHGVILVGTRPAGWEFALLALGRYGHPATLVTLDPEDQLLLNQHLRVEHRIHPQALIQALGSFPAALLGTAQGGSPTLEAALVDGATVVPLFAYRRKRGWCLHLGQGHRPRWAGSEERTTSKKEQMLEWLHRTCMRAVDAEARRLPDAWRWHTGS